MQQGEQCRMAQDFTYSKDHSSRLRMLINRDPTCQSGWNQIHGGVKFIQLKSVSHSSQGTNIRWWREAVEAMCLQLYVWLWKIDFIALDACVTPRVGLVGDYKAIKLLSVPQIMKFCSFAFWKG
ncbi:unnamed protein product, partial [Prunus brigantina]